MSKQLIGKKLGMTQLFEDNGNVVVCTIIHLKPNYVTQIKTKERDGYQAVQLAAFEKKKVYPLTDKAVNQHRTTARKVRYEYSNFITFGNRNRLRIGARKKISRDFT